MVFLVSVLLLIVIYLLCMVAAAFHEVKGQPRIPMFSCDKHGAVPVKYTLKLNVFSDQPIEVCPLCFEDKMKAAKRG